MFIVCIRNTELFKLIPLLCTHVYSYMFSTVHPPRSWTDYIYVLVRRMTQFSVWSTLVACARCPSLIWEVVFDYGSLGWQKKPIEAFNEAPPIATKNLWHNPIGVLRVQLIVGVIHGIFFFFFSFLLLENYESICGYNIVFFLPRGHGLCVLACLIL